jgi:hypothetical protein
MWTFLVYICAQKANVHRIYVIKEKQEKKKQVGETVVTRLDSAERR